MNLWEKIKTSFKGGVETISDQTTHWSQLAKLRWEQHNIERAIEKKFNELGGKVYQLHADGKQSQLKDETSAIVQDLNSQENKLQLKKKEIEDLIEKGVDAEHLKEFRKDLELGDGKIEQLVVEENAKIVGKKLMDIKFPKNVLIGAIVRNEKVIIPDGQTIFQKGDKLTLLGEKDDVEKALSTLSKG